MKHFLFRVNKGKENAWRDWCSYLCTHKVEAEKTMKAENCIYERSVMYKRNEEYYVVGTSFFDGEPKKADMNIEINKLHNKAKKECLGAAIAVFTGEFKMPPEYDILYEFDLRSV